MPNRWHPDGADGQVQVVNERGELSSLANNGGLMMVTGIPTADPHVVGAVWSNAGVLTVSAG